MEFLPPHAAVPISIPYRQGPNPPRMPTDLLRDADSKREYGFYEVLAAVFVELSSFVDTEPEEEVSEGVRRLVKSVENAFAEYGLPNPARKEMLMENKINATAQALRKCALAYLDKHFDTLVHYSRAVKDNCDSLFRMHDALHPLWRHTRRHVQGRDAPASPDDAYDEGILSLREAAQMYIQRRTQARTTVSYLEVNIAAHLFSAFIYWYEGGESPLTAPVRIYGPDVATFSSASNLAFIAIVVDPSDGTHRFECGTNGEWVHARGSHAVLPQHEGAELLGAKEAFEKRVRIVGGSTPLIEATREGGHAPEADAQELADLMTRGAAFLRPPEPDAAWQAERVFAAERATAARKAQRGEWREAAAMEQQKRAARSRRVDGKQMLGGYPRSRTSEVLRESPPLPRTWDQLSDAEQDLANQKLTDYGRDMDAKRNPKQPFKHEYAASKWQLQYVWEIDSLTGEAKTAREKVRDAVKNSMARRVWRDTHAVQRMYVATTPQGQREWRVDGLPDYKRVTKPRSDEEVAGLANRRMLVSQWMRGYMQQPVTADGAPRDDADELRCQSARHFINNFSILDHPNLKYVLSQCDDAERQALEDEYADFMAAERRLLMNVLRRVERPSSSAALREAYKADAASFAWCGKDEEAPTASDERPSATPAGGDAPVWSPKTFTRTIRTVPREAIAIRTTSSPQRWKKRYEKGGDSSTNNYSPRNAKALMTEMKAFRDKKKMGNASEHQKHWTNFGNIPKRKFLSWHVGQHETMLMPDKPNGSDTNEEYNAALVRMLEFLDQLHPLEQPRYCKNFITGGRSRSPPKKRGKGKRSSGGDEDEDEGNDVWNWKDAALRDPLILGNEQIQGCKDILKAKTANHQWSERVKQGYSVLEMVIRRYIEYAREHDAIFKKEDPDVWGTRGKVVDREDGAGALKAYTLVSAFWSELLSCFPAEQQEDNKLNSIMSFVRWYHQHVWSKYDRTEGYGSSARMFKRTLCQIVGVPNINSWKTSSTDEWEHGGYEHKLKTTIGNYLDTLWTAVSYTKNALDFAVVDPYSPLKYEPYRHILEEWVQTHTMSGPELVYPAPPPAPPAPPAPAPAAAAAPGRRRRIIADDTDGSDDDGATSAAGAALDGGFDA